MEHVLLVGGGDGLDLQFFNPSIKVTYLDSAVLMLNIAKRKYVKRENTEFILSDFNEFALKEQGQFDLVCLHFCLTVTNNPSLMLEGVSKLLKRGGLLSILDMGKVKQNRLSKTLNFVTKQTMFNMFYDIEGAMKQHGELVLVNKNPLIESNKFVAYIYEKK